VTARARRRAAFGRYLLASAVGNLVWEVVQLPLFDLPPRAGTAFLATIVALGEGGDVMIAAGSLGLALVMVGDERWPARRRLAVAAATLAFGLSYTMMSEYVHVMVLGTWRYAPAMPRLPLLGIGLSPVLQWIVVPLLALACIGRGQAGLGVPASTAARARAISSGKRGRISSAPWRRRR
jgi:hypothetical protein